MGGIEGVEQPLVAPAPLPIIAQHEGRGQDAVDLVVPGEELRPRKVGHLGGHEAHIHHPVEEVEHGEGQYLRPPVPAEQVEHQPHGQHRPTAVPGDAPDGEDGVAGDAQRGGQGGERRQQPGGQKGPGQGEEERRQAPDHAPLPQPVDALEYHHENDKGGHHAVGGVEPVRPHQQSAEGHKQQQGGHGGGEDVDPCEVPLPAVGVGEALHQAEQEQGRAQPPHHTEPLGDAPGKAEKVVNVVQHHGDQGDPFQPRLGQPPGGGDMMCFH